MRKAISLIVTMALVVVLAMLSTAAYAAEETVTLSADGALSDALAQVADGGTIVVDGTVAVTKALGAHNKTVTITGGELDFTGLTGSVHLGDHITFENITLTFKDAASVVCNGYTVTMGEGITMTNTINIYGGANNKNVASTNLTVLSGTYYKIFGGGYNYGVTGDSYLYVGGNVNADIDATDHAHTYCVYGGNNLANGNSTTTGGTVTTVFADQAQANYVYGGNLGTGEGIIKGGTDVIVSGGTAVSIYGGNRDGVLTGDTKVLISGGAIEQVFGGCESNSMTGDVAVDITGGTITRRVYGGCYNNYDSGWTTNYYVNGNVVLTLHGGANITYSYDGNDTSVYAHSRHETLSGTEVSHLVYADSTAYSKYKNNVKAQDWAMQIIMGSTSAADHIHYHTYSASGAVITQNCIDNSCTASATLVVEGNSIFGGNPVKPAKVTYSGDWFGGKLDIAYANNTGVGTGTASITCGGATATKSFTIAEPHLTMNGQGYGCLEAALAAARKTRGADTITLEKDLDLSSWLVIDTDVTITANKAVTITATDSQLGSMIRVIGGTFTVKGASENAKITLAAGKNTAHIVSNNGGNVVLTNVQLAGNKNTVHTIDNKACGIFNYEGTTTAKSVVIEDMVKGDGIYVMNDTTVNLDNVTVSGSGRYGIKVKGTLNITNTVNSDHALTVSGSAKHAIDVENGGEVTCGFENASAVKLFGKGLNVRNGGDADLPYVSEEN
ncbi:MAG: hypothetical protein IJO45_04605 [Oscillospiraceae bacterium]|nr:hypothetical protein [Oscillospiraceae bacterium]